MDLKEKILQNLNIDPWYLDVKAVMESKSTLEGRFEGYSISYDGLLIYRGSNYVLEVGELQNLIIVQTHKMPYSKYLGVKKMNANLK